MMGGLISIPFVGLIALNHSNFYLSMIFSALTIFFSGSYFSPGITMMQNSVNKENSGNVVGAYSFVATIASTISPIIFGFLASIFKAKYNPYVYGYLIASFVAFGYSISSYFYYKAGINYSLFMKNKEKNTL